MANPTLSGLLALGRLGRLGTTFGTARKLSKLNVYRDWDGGTASTEGVYIPRLRRVIVRRRRAVPGTLSPDFVSHFVGLPQFQQRCTLTKPDQSRPNLTKPEKKGDSIAPTRRAVAERRRNLSEAFRPFPNLKIFSDGTPLGQRPPVQIPPHFPVRSGLVSIDVD